MLYKRRNISDETILNVGKKRPRYLSMVHSSGNVSTRALHLLFKCVPDLEVNKLYYYETLLELALVAQSVSAFGC